MPTNTNAQPPDQPAKSVGLWPLFIPVVLGIGPAQCSATLGAVAPVSHSGPGLAAWTPLGGALGLVTGLAVAVMAAKLLGRWFGPIPSKREQAALPAGQRASGIALGLLGIVGFFLPGVLLIELTKRGLGASAALILPVALAIALAWSPPPEPPSR